MQDLNRTAGWPAAPRVLLPPSERLTTDIVGTTPENKRFPTARVAARIMRADFVFDPAVADVCSVVLVKTIDLRDADVVTIVLRVHACTFTADQLVQLKMYNAAPSPEEPQANFVDGLNPILGFDAGLSAPDMLVQSMTAPLPAYGQLQLVCSQDVSVGGTVTFTISGSVLVRGRCVRPPDGRVA